MPPPYPPPPAPLPPPDPAPLPYPPPPYVPPPDPLPPPPPPPVPPEVPPPPPPPAYNSNKEEADEGSAGTQKTFFYLICNFSNANYLKTCFNAEKSIIVYSKRQDLELF